MVSVHISQQLGRPAEFYPELGTGVALYAVILLLVLTGYLHRYQLFSENMKLVGEVPHANRYVHIALTLALYITLLVHVLKNTGLI